MSNTCIYYIIILLRTSQELVLKDQDPALIQPQDY